MNYPIFNSITNLIEAELTKRSLDVVTFRTWKENRINATGLELSIDISQHSDYIKKVIINFDWDKFRETSLARQLKGMEKHPLLIEDQDVSFNLPPTIDIEVVWLFNESVTATLGSSPYGTDRIDAASKWMETINGSLPPQMHGGDTITRWHIEIEGDDHGRYLSVMSLNTYLQYSFVDLNALADVHQFILRKLQYLLMITQKVIQISEESVTTAVAV